MKAKKADFVWISWVLLMAFVVGLSAVMYNWIFGFTTSSTEQIEERATNSQQCDLIGISIDHYCQDTKNLYLDITNRNSLSVQRLVINMFDVYNDPITDNAEYSVKIEPGKTGRVV